MEIDDITGVIVDSAVKIHRDLGSSLFESVYELALAAVLERRGLRVARQQPIAFSYEGVEFTHGRSPPLIGTPRDRGHFAVTGEAWWHARPWTRHGNDAEAEREQTMRESGDAVG